MSLPNKNPNPVPRWRQASADVASHFIATIQKHLTGAEVLDLQEVAGTHAQLVEAIDQREYQHLAAVRKRLRAKHHARERLDRAASVLLEAIPTKDL